MKKYLLLIGFLMLGSLSSYSQNAIAKIKYEDAELDFSNQNYVKALVTLTEVETLLGRKTPKVSHLKIMAGSKIIEANPYNDFELIKQIKDEANFFLKEYQDLVDYEEKYKEVYFGSEKLKKYPTTLDEFLKQKKADDDAKLAEQIKKEQLRLEAIEALKKAQEAEKAYKIEAAKQERQRTRRHCAAMTFDYVSTFGLTNALGGSITGIRKNNVSIYFAGFASIDNRPWEKIPIGYSGKSTVFNKGGLTVGLTYPFLKSFTVYLGAGGGIGKRIFTLNRIEYEDFIDEDKDIFLSLETGLVYQIGRNVFIKSGIQSFALSNTSFTIGLGLALPRK
jgi:hypothetical protein